MHSETSGEMSRRLIKPSIAQKGNEVSLKDIDKRLKTCKWCYQIFLVEKASSHFDCLKKRNQFIQKRKRSINYDKTKGQKNDRTSAKV